MSEYDTANEHVLCFQIGKLKRRIADLSQALGLITTLKPTMVMDADHPLDMAKEVVEYMTTIIANTQQANRGLCANYIYELNENIKLTARIAKLEAENERLKEELQYEKTRSQLNLEAEERRMLNITYYCAEIDRLNARIAELEAAQRWIPVSERLPVGGKVLVLWKDRTIHLDWTFIDGGRYYWWNSGDNVTHWMPLPQPPEVQE